MLVNFVRVPIEWRGKSFKNTNYMFLYYTKPSLILNKHPPSLIYTEHTEKQDSTVNTPFSGYIHLTMEHKVIRSKRIFFN